MQRQASGYAEIDAPDESHNVSFLLTLLTMLDFTQPGQVQKEDWERGVGALYAPGLSWEVSWQMLLRRFDLDFNGSIDFGEMHGLAPLDPRLGSLLRVMMQTLVRLSERINGAYAGINETKMKMMRGTVNQWRDKITATAFKAWRDDVRSIAARRAIVLANMKYAPCRKCFHGIKEMRRPGIVLCAGRRPARSSSPCRRLQPREPLAIFWPARAAPWLKLVHLAAVTM